MRALITGASGFAGGYLARACAEDGDEVVGVSRRGTVPPGCGRGVSVDLRDGAAVRSVVRDVRPDVVYHLAALSSVGRAWEQPQLAIDSNVSAAVSVLDAVRLEAPGARVVWAGSCQVYGSPERLPVDEDAPVRPDSPYAVSKAAGEMLATVYAEAHGLDVIRARPFNHSGPGQPPTFILSSLARQAAEARLSGADRVELRTGRAETRRDFTDVRDVARAYRLLASEADPGVYNISSGRSVSAAEQVALVAELIAPVEVDHVVDADRVRAHEMLDLSGSHDRLTAATGWRPSIPLHQTMRDTIEWWAGELTATESPRPGVRH
jgi:GDP-4-dehydro-6-deoxy-D-mannose reductase